MEAMDSYHKALLRLLTTLFAAAGIVEGHATAACLPRLIRNQILRVLLPIESAVRRVVFYRAQRMEMPPEPEKKTPSGPGPDTLGYWSQHRRKPKRKKRGKLKGPRAAVFWLFDKLRYCPHTSDPHRRPPRGGPGPRMSFFDGSDPLPEPVVEKEMRDPNDAVKLCRRLQAVKHALDDIDGQALRLKRLIARREIAAKTGHAKPLRTDPLREGFAPGYRPEHTQEVDEILYACNLLARDPAPPLAR